MPEIDKVVDLSAFRDKKIVPPDSRIHFFQPGDSVKVNTVGFDPCFDSRKRIIFGVGEVYVHGVLTDSARDSDLAIGYAGGRVIWGDAVDIEEYKGLYCIDVMVEKMPLDRNIVVKMNIGDTNLSLQSDIKKAGDDQDVTQDIWGITDEWVIVGGNERRFRFYAPPVATDLSRLDFSFNTSSKINKRFKLLRFQR